MNGIKGSTVLLIRNMRNDKIFFRPRIGKYYEEGWQGARTMVVGVHLLCELNCELKPRCCSMQGVRQMDCLCPEYAKHRGTEYQDYYRLSNCNSIELDSYIENEAKSPSFSMLTSFLLQEKGFVSIERRQELWDHLGFYNFFQHFQPDADTPSPDDNPQLSRDGLAAFRELLTKYEPQTLIVYSRQLAAFLRSQRMEGLTFYHKEETPILDIFIFNFNYIPHTKLTENQIFGLVEESLAHRRFRTEKLKTIAHWFAMAIGHGIIGSDNNGITVKRTSDAAYLGRAMTAVFDLTWAEFDSLMNYTHKTLRNAHREYASANTVTIIDALVDCIDE